MTSDIDGKPCGHPGCLSHLTHPCEGCGRIAGRSSIDGLLHDLRRREARCRKAAQDTPAGLSLDKGMLINDADQLVRWIVAVEELRSESEETERQHGYEGYFNGNQTGS